LRTRKPPLRSILNVRGTVNKIGFPHTSTFTMNLKANDAELGLEAQGRAVFCPSGRREAPTK